MGPHDHSRLAESVHAEMNTPDRIAAILREDPELTLEQANQLAELYRIAYAGVLEIKSVLQSGQNGATLESSLRIRPSTGSDAPIPKASGDGRAVGPLR